MDFSAALACLGAAVAADPSVQERLFAITDAVEFRAEVAKLAEELGCPVAAADLEQTMRRRHRAWIERNLP